MKPALLYLRKYIQQNYNGDRYQDSDKKSLNQDNIKKNSKQSIFKEKRKYEWQNQNKKEFYFKTPKSFNASRIQNKIKLQERNSQSGKNISQTLVGEPKNTIKYLKESQQQPKSKENKSKITLEKQRNNQECIYKKIEVENAVENQVKFIISPPKKVQRSAQESQNCFQEFHQGPNTKQNVQQNLSHLKIASNQRSESIIQKEMDNEQHIIDHTKMTCKSMKKFGYENLSEYLQQMKNFQKINKKQIKEACYYPLDCMKPSLSNSQSYQKDYKIIKSQIKKKVQQFSKLIQIQENFTFNTVQKQLKNSLLSTQNILKCKKPNFSKNKKNLEVKIEQKGEKSLLQYEKILICNCMNKKFFTFQLSKDTDYNSFLKLTTSLLQTASSKENNYVSKKQEITNFDGLHFCCLINQKQSQKETFFWVGKPIQYYRKDLILKAIDIFLYEINGLSMIENQKIWIVDFHGRNSFIMKKMLIKCNQQKPNNNLSLPKKQNLKMNKRMSLSQQLAQLDLTESLLNLMTNSSQFKESSLVKKQKNYITKKGEFQMVYKSKESLR